jgi:CheY-like chemotaxis protein
MDHMMPEMSGVDATRLIRGIDSEYAKNVPIVALTANAQTENRDIFLLNGFDGFITKPIDVLELDSVINKYIGKKAQGVMKNESQNNNTKKSKVVKTEIDGLDIQKGIDAYGGIKVFSKILSSFVKHCPQMLDALSSPTKENLQDYQIKVHGLKGAASGVWAVKVSTLAQELETAAKKGDFETIEIKNPELLSATRLLINNIHDVYGKKKKAPAQKKPVKDAPDSALLSSLLEETKLFHTGNMQKIIHELNGYSYKNDSELIDFLTKEVEALEYETIIKKLT